MAVSVTVNDDITKVQDRLHDNGTIWSQTELLRAYNDGYRQLLTRSAAVKDHFCFDVPPRYAYTFSYEWEDSAINGPIWMCMLGMRVNTWRGTTRWEAQQAEHVGEVPTDMSTTTGEFTGITQQWERFITGDVDRNYDLVFPRNEKTPSRVRFNNTIMLPITTLELDQVHINWPSFVGQPYWWTAGFGRVKTIEIYRIQTTYTQAYQLIYPSGVENQGVPRNWSGVRTYGQDLVQVSAFNTVGYTATPADGQVLNTVRPSAESVVGFGALIPFYQAVDTNSVTWFCLQTWEQDTILGNATIRTGSTPGTYRWESLVPVQVDVNTTMGSDALTFAVGVPRSLSSPDRQYLPIFRGAGMSNIHGTLREWGSSDGNFFVTFTAINQSDLQVSQFPDLIPSQLTKYIRYYVLAQAFIRPGEGHQPALAAHWLSRFEGGVKLLRKLNDVAFQDKIYVREEVGITEMRRVPLVQLPPQFERIW